LSIRHLESAAAAVALLAAVAIPATPAYADNIRDRQWHLRSLKVAETRSITTGEGVTVAVVDTGTYPHPDLRKNLLDGTDETKGSGDGHTDDAGHGTRMAALIAAHGRGSNGVVGIAPDAKVLPVRVSQKEEGKDINDMARGIAWAADHGAKIINVSLAGGPDFDLTHAVNKALDQDVVVVAAAGNAPKGILIGYPAALDGVLAVGATGRNGEYASVSRKDAKIQICAPGVDITSATPKSGYSLADGNSDSTAIVSGAAALVRAKFPELSAKDVINRLTATADDIGAPGRDNECGFGRLNIVKALTADVPPLEAGTVTSVAPASAAETTPPTLVATTPAASSEDAPAGSAGPLVLGVLAGLVVAGGLVAFFVLRRRRSF
jgi:type VII secretion-associated serine protease mycosin